MTVKRPKPKQLLRPITTGVGIAMNQSQFPAIICNSLVAREKSRVHGAVCFGFDSHWLKNWRESFKVAYYSFIRVQEVYTVNVQI